MLCVKERVFTPLRDVSLDDLVPADHFYRHLDAKLDLTFVRAWVCDTYTERGRPSIDPVVFFRLQLVLFFEGIRSERELLRIAGDRRSVRWYLGDDLDQPLPDHSRLTRIRERYGLAIFQRFFEHVGELCLEAGLVRGKELFCDATPVHANADLTKMVPRFAWEAKQHVAELFGIDAGQGAPESATETQPVLLVPAPRETPTPLPAGLSPEAQVRLADQNLGVWKLLDTGRLDPNRPSGRGYQRLSDFQVSTTDPDATPMSIGGRSTLGYHDHDAVDGGKARIILAALVTPADVMEHQPLRDLRWRTCFRWKLQPKRVNADTTDGTAENIVALEDAGIRAYFPLPDFTDRSSFYGTKDFTFDAEKDEYRCLQGETSAVVA
jgi:transposase